VTEQEIEQRRREDVAAVDYHVRAVEAAQERVNGAADKIEKFEQHVKSLKDDLKAAKANLAAEEETLTKVRKRAEQVLAEGPVTISGEMVYAVAQTAHGVGSVN
jgi:peptidoglycan hydrolase CwlO-like protein